jgi:biopolymer transport protein ExbD
VKAHEKTKYSDYIAVMDQLKMANAKRISIAEID